VDEHDVDGHDFLSSDLGPTPAMLSSGHATRRPCCVGGIAPGRERLPPRTRQICRAVSTRRSKALQGNAETTSRRQKRRGRGEDRHAPPTRPW
jgi:hypothetical protein